MTSFMSWTKPFSNLTFFLELVFIFLNEFYTIVYVQQNISILNVQFDEVWKYVQPCKHHPSPDTEYFHNSHQFP